MMVYKSEKFSSMDDLLEWINANQIDVVSVLPVTAGVFLGTSWSDGYYVVYRG